jgi:hypothetical protein
MNNFKKNKYLVLKKVIDPKIANFLTEYLLLKKEVANTLTKLNYIPEYLKDTVGVFNDPQVPNAYSIYSDIANEVLLKRIKPIMEKNTGLKLVETYSYARIYQKGNILHRHKDRPSCEISTTINLGGDPWPIYLEPSGKTNKKGIKVDLSLGDMLVYRGCELEHWREPFTKNYCVQVFLHYNRATKKAIKFDGRPHLGLPCNIKNETI